MPPLSSKVKYGLVLPDGSLARITVRPSHGDCCNDTTCSLTNDQNQPEFLVNSPEDIANVLFDDTPWYNSTPEKPGWGNYERHELRPVKVTMVVETADIQPPVNIDPIDTRDIPRSLVKMYSQKPIDKFKTDQRFVFVLVAENLDDMKLLIGQKVCFSSIYNTRFIFDAVPTPEEYVGECEEYFNYSYKRKDKEKKFCLLICFPDELY